MTEIVPQGIGSILSVDIGIYFRPSGEGREARN